MSRRVVPFKRDRAPCESCGKVIGQRTDGSGPTAHRCPHRRPCVRPAWTNSKAKGCEPCAERMASEKAKAKLADDYCETCAALGFSGIPHCPEHAPKPISEPTCVCRVCGCEFFNVDGCPDCGAQVKEGNE